MSDEIKVNSELPQKLATLGQVKEALDKRDEKIDSLKEDLSNKITKFYASNQGETHITDSDNGKIQDMKVFGNSEQKKYNGYQLFALAPINISTGEKVSLPYTENGITVDIANDGIGYTVHGTNTLNERESDVYLSMTNAFDIEAGTYTRSGKIINGNNNVELISGGGVSNGGCLEYKPIKADFTFTETVKKGKSGNFIIRISPRATVNAIVYFQIEKGSEAHNFEPYTGGIPSPNPDYPQKIKSVVNPTVKVCGKNLWNPILGGYISGIDGSIVAASKKQIAATDFIKTSGKDITVIARNFSSAMESSYAYRIGFYNAEKKWIKNAVLSDGNKHSINTFNITGTEYIRVSAPSGIYDTIQIEYGSEATPYEPYTEQSVQLPYTLNAIPVTSGGNVTIDGQQYVSDRVVEKDGVFGIERNIREVHTNTKTMNNSEEYPGWNKVEGVSDTVYYSTQFTEDSRKVTHISNFTQLTFLQNNKGTNNILYCLKKVIGYSQSELIAKAIDVDMYIRLQNAIFEPLPGDIQVKLQTFVTNYPVTNISVTSDQLDGYTVFNYPISMANGWNYVKQQLNDNRDYIYDMDLQSAEAYVNSEYAVALTELEV